MSQTTRNHFSERSEYKLVGAALTASFCLLAYVIMAGIACFAAWTTDYWNLAKWDAVPRAVLFLLWLILIARGVWATVVMIREMEL